MANKDYLTTFVNDSAVICDTLAANISDAVHKAVAYDSDGNLIVPAKKGDAAIGLILSACADDENITVKGRSVNVLIAKIGLGIASGAIKKGDFVTADTNGGLVKAGAGEFIFGVALSNAADGECFQVQITKSGFTAAASSTTKTSTT